MADAKITDDDRIAAGGIEYHALGDETAQTIANARAAGREQAAERMDAARAALEAHAEQAHAKFPDIAASDRASAATYGNAADAIRALEKAEVSA